MDNAPGSEFSANVKRLKAMEAMEEFKAANDRHKLPDPYTEEDLIAKVRAVLPFEASAFLAASLAGEDLSRINITPRLLQLYQEIDSGKIDAATVPIHFAPFAGDSTIWTADGLLNEWFRVRVGHRKAGLPRSRF